MSLNKSYFHLQIHILKEHPEQADDLIFRCRCCSFTTINQTQLALHERTKHVEAAENDKKMSHETGTTKNTQ